MIVVDASVLIEVLQRSDVGAQVQERLFKSGLSLHAPHLIDVEITHAFRRLAAAGAISGEHGRTMLSLLVAMPIRRYAHGFLLSRAWELRSNVTAYDAVYVALAALLDAPLITRDGRLAAAVGDLIEIELL